MEYKIIETPHNDFPDKEMLNLLHDAYKERVDQNIKFGCSSYTLEEYQDHTKNGIFFVAYDNGKPVASLTLINKNIGCYKFGHVCNVAVSSKIKRSGVGSIVCDNLTDYAKTNGYIFLTSTTATTAFSSVKWHFRQGFKRFKYIHFPDKDYDSFYFVKILKWNLLTLIIMFVRIPVFCLTFLYSKLN